MTPAQFVFGRNPRIPSNLLDEPLNVVPPAASLYEESLQRSVEALVAAHLNKRAAKEIPATGMMHSCKDR